MTPEAEQWVSSGRALALSDDVSAEFDAYLATSRWHSSALDWRMIPHVSINVAENSVAEFSKWLISTRIGLHSHVAVWYSAEEGGIVIPREKLLPENLDELYWKAPGVRLLFGLDLKENVLVPSYADILEYGFGDLYFAVAR